jgi:hypothetical protein
MWEQWGSNLFTLFVTSLTTSIYVWHQITISIGFIGDVNMNN